ncbi:hypothetical protein [Nonomuraea sp. WAC 01424]|nr:hypothetical protein [Nonomuraea sp. WAC 01424]
MAAAMSVSAFNVGITVGPWLGGLAIAAGAGYPSVGWIGAVLGVAALGTVALSARTRREPVAAAHRAEAVPRA